MVLWGYGAPKFRLYFHNYHPQLHCLWAWYFVILIHYTLLIFFRSFNSYCFFQGNARCGSCSSNGFQEPSGCGRRNKSSLSTFKQTANPHARFWTKPPPSCGYPSSKCFTSDPCHLYLRSVSNVSAEYPVYRKFI